jgi:hypothetical protein
MPRKFKTEEERRAWAEKMKEARLKKKLENQSQAQPKENTLKTEPGKVWIKHKSGDILLVPEWLAQDLIRLGEAQKYEG